MFDWVGSAQIKTGKKIKVATDEKDELGEPIMTEVDEILTPVDLLARVISGYVVKKASAAQGPIKAQIGKILKEEAAAMGGGSLSPFALQQLYKGKLGPAAGELLMGYLPKKKNITDGNISPDAGGERY
jgi:hypothetical protein